MIALVLGLSIVLAMLAAHVAGARAGARAALRDPGDQPELGAINGALLGLLGLLLAFSFSSASQRYIDRQDLVVREANALGTAWLRTEAASDARRDALRRLLVAYADTRVAYGLAAADTDAVAKAEKDSAALHPRLWAAGLEAARESPALSMLLLPALNDVIDLHATHAAATRRHHPLAVLILLGAASLAATSLLGYAGGVSGRRHPLAHTAFSLLVASVLWLTIDLDYPRAGFIRFDITPLVDARAAMTP